MTSSTGKFCEPVVAFLMEFLYRIMEGEAYTDIVKIRRKDRLEQAKRNLSKSWIPTSDTKKPTGVGSYYGCFHGRIEAFSAAQKVKPTYKSPGCNFLTTPSKRGTGYGYVNVTIGPYQKYASEPYDRAKELRKKESSDEIKKRKGGAFKLSSHGKDYFDENPYHSKKSLPPPKDASYSSKDKPKPFQPSSPAKMIGGCKAGTFTPYPEHPKDPFLIPKMGDKNASKKFRGGIFRPSQCPKSMPTHSIVNQHVQRTMNSTNFSIVKC